MADMIYGGRCRVAFRPDRTREAVDLTAGCIGLAPESTPAGIPAALDRLAVEVTDLALARDVLRVGATGSLSVSWEAVGFAHDYGHLRVAYNEPTVRASEPIAWTVILEPIRADR